MPVVELRDGSLVFSGKVETLNNKEKLKLWNEASDWYDNNPASAMVEHHGKVFFKQEFMKQTGANDALVRVCVAFPVIKPKLQDLWLEEKVTLSFVRRSYTLDDKDLDEAIAKTVIESPSKASYWLEDGVFKTDYDIEGKTELQIMQEHVTAKRWLGFDFLAEGARVMTKAENEHNVSVAFGLTGGAARAGRKLLNLGSAQVIDAYFNGRIRQSNMLNMVKESKREQNRLLAILLGEEMESSAGAGGELSTDEEILEGSGSSVRVGSDRNGKYFEVRIYRASPSATAKNLQTEFGKDGHGELTSVVKRLVTMIANKHVYQEQDTYSQYNYLEGVSDGEIADVAICIVEEGMPMDEIGSIYGLSEVVARKCVDIYEKEMRPNTEE